MLLVSPAMGADDPEGYALDRIVGMLLESGLDVRTSVDTDGLTDPASTMHLDADVVVLDWRLPGAADAVSAIREVDHDVGIFLIAEPSSLGGIPVDTLSMVNEYVWLMDDSPSFIAGRIDASARRYRRDVLPPMFSALAGFSEDYEYSWHTPGHTAGTAFLKSPAGRLFYDFFGEQLFRSDLSISVGELGSLLDHSGPIGDAERYASDVFGSDLTYFVTNGTSTSNRVVHMSVTPPGGVELVDRNCHKSIEHALTMSHAVPVYMMPTRNGYGIMGPIPPSEMSEGTVRDRIMDCPLLGGVRHTDRPTIAVVTNSTYDGVCYDAVAVEETLGEVTDCVHFDEAWYAYARFNPLYAGRYAMRDHGSTGEDRPTVFATQSTHKLLAALSQASMIHVRQGRHHVEPSLFNETYMMHASTSPQYAIIASMDVSSKMMDTGGRALTQESIDEAVRFRQTMARIRSDSEGWWFRVWQPDRLDIPDVGEGVRFEDVPHDRLVSDPSCWTMHPGDAWHGFGDIPDGWAMLDPIKVTVLTPGMDDGGNYTDFGIPAAIVVAFLDQRGIVNEKSGDYNILFLFSMGVTKGKWGTLVSEFFEFRRLFDEGAVLDDVLPDLVARYPERYSGMTLPHLAREMHEQIRRTRQTQVANRAFGILPVQAMTPARAYSELVRGNVEQVRLDDIDDRIVATGVVPYPPGVPMLMPGERTGKRGGPILTYLRALQEFDRRFPGFEHDSHGVEFRDGHYWIHCVRG